MSSERKKVDAQPICLLTLLTHKHSLNNPTCLSTYPPTNLPTYLYLPIGRCRGAQAVASTSRPVQASLDQRGRRRYAGAVG